MKKALLVLDAQKIYTSSGSELYCKESPETMERINRLIKVFERKGDLVIFVRHIHKKDGSDLGRMFDYAGPADDFNFKEGTEEVEFDSRLHRPRKVVEVIKNRYSAFAGTSLDQQLQRGNVQRVAICGFMTNFCCDSTARDAHDRDYYVDFIVDATGSPGIESMDQRQIRKVVAALLSEGYATIHTTNRYLTTV